MYFGMFDKRKKMGRKIGGAKGFLPWPTKLQSPQFGEKSERFMQLTFTLILYNFFLTLYFFLLSLFLDSFFSFCPIFSFFLLLFFFITFHSYPFFCVHCSSVFPFICFFFFFQSFSFHISFGFLYSLSLSLLMKCTIFF